MSSALLAHQKAASADRAPMPARSVWRLASRRTSQRPRDPQERDAQSRQVSLAAKDVRIGMMVRKNRVLLKKPESTTIPSGGPPWARSSSRAI